MGKWFGGDREIEEGADFIPSVATREIDFQEIVGALAEVIAHLFVSSARSAAVLSTGWTTSTLRWADLIMLEGNGVYMHEADNWRAQGMLVIGGGVESAKWETDRAYGMKVFRKTGIPVPLYREFTDYDTAIAYVRRKSVPLVSKPSGNCDDKALSYIAKSPDDLLFMLDRWRRAGKRAGLEFILQEKVRGIEFAAGAYGQEPGAGGSGEFAGTNSVAERSASTRSPLRPLFHFGRIG